MSERDEAGAGGASRAPGEEAAGPPPEAGEARRAREDAELQALLLELGVPAVEVERSAAEGTLAYLAMEKVVSLEEPRFDLAEVCALSGIDPEVLTAYWRALGFPDPRPGEKLFTETDLEMLSTVVTFIAQGALQPDLALQMARVIASAMDKVATAQVDALEVRRETGAPPVPTLAPGSARGTAELLALVPKVMEYVWRRQLAAAARRRILRAAAGGPEDGESVLVGFADLVGFTAKTQQLEEHELAEVVGRFEAIAYDTVSRHGGRVVKMIGDEVMFLHDDVVAGARLALALADAFRRDEALSDVRVGLAYGPVLERDGDVYGAVVNLANRIVTVAYPGSVVVSEEVFEALRDDDELLLRSLRSHILKDIGRVPLWVLRHAHEEGEVPYQREVDRRAARQFLRERWAEMRREARLLSTALPGRLRAEVLDHAAAPGGPSQEVLATGQFEAISEAVLDSDLDPEAQIDLLAGLEAARRLQRLEAEAQEKAAEADLEAERRLEEVEREARRKVEEIEREARRKVEQILTEAEERSRRINEDASRKVKRVAEEAERRAERAEKEAKAVAERKAKRKRDGKGKGKGKG